jgi:two-component system, cell cycle sensor histidine kinase and response regulator CckA
MAGATGRGKGGRAVAAGPRSGAKPLGQERANLLAGACESAGSSGTFAHLMLASMPGSPDLSMTSSSPQRVERPPGGYTVLVVDDEEAVRRLASRMLTWGGYQALEARHGREALATIEQHAGPIHLVLTDIKMPGMNGRELGREIERRWPDTRLLYMSGFASEVFQGGLLEAGAPFLAKPFTQEDLTGKVRVLLETDA